MVGIKMFFGIFLIKGFVITILKYLEIEKVERIENKIKSYYEEKLKLQKIIYKNEKYLKNK